MDDKKETTILTYEVIQMIPAPEGLVSVYIDRTSLEDNDSRSAEQDVVCFAVYNTIEETFVAGCPVDRPKKYRMAGPLVIGELGYLVPPVYPARLELNGQLYGTRYHLNSRHEETRLHTAECCLMNNVIPPDNIQWPEKL